MTHFTVLFDACVLYPAELRNLLMYLALTDLFRARWTDRIHDEWMNGVLKDRLDLTRDKLFRVRDLMNAHVRDALVTDFDDLIPSLTLPDPDDRRTIRAAVTPSGRAAYDRASALLAAHERALDLRLGVGPRAELARQLLRSERAPGRLRRW